MVQFSNSSEENCFCSSPNEKGGSYARVGEPVNSKPADPEVSHTKPPLLVERKNLSVNLVALRRIRSRSPNPLLNIQHQMSLETWAFWAQSDGGHLRF